jgi:hypothetical protein
MQFGSWRVGRLVIVSAVLLIFAGTEGRAQSSLAIGMAGSGPVVFTECVAGLSVRLSKITYNRFGNLDSYTIELTSAASKSSVQVIGTPTRGSDTQPRYVANVAGRQIPSLDIAKLKVPIGFSPTEPGSVVVPGGTTLETSFAYDDFGRQQVARQSFTIGHRRTEAVFSAFTRDGFGRLTSYQVELK